MTELATLKAQHDSCVHELGEATQRLDITTATLKLQSEELGATETELADKKTALAQLTNTPRQTEHRLAELEPSATQVIHDQHKKNEARQLRDKLDKERAENRVLRENMSQLETELRQLRSQAMGPSPSASLSRSQSDTDPEKERLRTDLRNKEAELQGVKLQLSNAQLAHRRPGSNPFMPPRRR
jgi:DNA repair exonuclease SbcCD ATPase subunit